MLARVSSRSVQGGRPHAPPNNHPPADPILLASSLPNGLGVES